MASNSDVATKKDTEALDSKIDKLSDKVDIKFDKFAKDFDKKIDKAVDDLSSVMQTFMHQVSDEFEKVHIRLDKHDADIQKMLNLLDALEKQHEIDDTERKVMAIQLQRLHDWTVKAAKQINVSFEPHK